MTQNLFITPMQVSQIDFLLSPDAKIASAV